jgi:ferredoxin
VRECPIKGAISIETVTPRTAAQRKPPVVHEPCVGCGVCEMICPTEPACIEIVPREVWKHEHAMLTRRFLDQIQIKAMFGREPAKPRRFPRAGAEDPRLSSAPATRKGCRPPPRTPRRT